jgi:hypothetical protein
MGVLKPLPDTGRGLESRAVSFPKRGKIARVEG